MVFEETRLVFEETRLVFQETPWVFQATRLVFEETRLVFQETHSDIHKPPKPKSAKGCVSGSSVRNAKRKESLNPCRGFSFAVLVLLHAKTPLADKVFFGSFF